MVTIHDYKVDPRQEIIDATDVQIIYIPLESSLGYAYKPTIKVGNYVSIGMTLGVSSVCDAPLLSTVSGIIVGYEDKYINNGKLVKCIVIENDFKDKYQNKVGKKNDITNYSKKEFIEILKKCNIIGMGGAGFPTYIKYDTNKKIKYLIINGTECEIYTSSDNALMYNHPEEILEGIDAIMEIMGIEKSYIAISDNNQLIIDKLLMHINTYPNIKIYPVLSGYPNGYERYLVNTIIGKDYNKIPLEVNTIVNNVSTIYAIYEALKYHKPPIERIVTISGNGIKKPANYLLRVGTNFNEILLKNSITKKINRPIIVSGGAMMGKSLPNDNLVVTPNLNTILIMEDNNETSSPCIKCGKCSEVCPVNLIPSLIMETKDKSLKIDKCIKCGLCSYVCPSKIEVCEEIKKIKEGKNE